MRDALSRVLVLPDEQEDDEQLYDIARAYGLLVNVCGNVGTAEHKLCSAKVRIMVLNVGSSSSSFTSVKCRSCHLLLSYRRKFEGLKFSFF